MPTPMPKSVQTNFLENISNLKSSENLSNTWRNSLFYRLVVTDLLGLSKPNWTRSLSPSLLESRPYLQEI
jgi:hypothetical protein